MRWLIRLYPAQWRERYGEEMDQLVRDLRPATSRRAIAMSLIGGALGAHARAWHWAAIGRGALIAAVVWFGLSVELVLTNVVFPACDDSSIAIVVSYVCVFAALFAIGRVAVRTGAGRRVQVLAGTVAGMMIGAFTIASSAVVDNVWLGIVSRQPQKVQGFAQSGEASMRAYINHGLIGPAIFGVVLFGLFGAIMSGFAGVLSHGRAD
ncbi:MAG TPA: hypothetical protein VGJ28_20455 [Micromonosporaceae bacterium]|jgi:hypothetical protein